MTTCPTCGGPLIGDGLTVARHCENVDVFDVEPDANPVFCVSTTQPEKPMRLIHLPRCADSCELLSVSCSHPECRAALRYDGARRLGWTLDADAGVPTYYCSMHSPLSAMDEEHPSNQAALANWPVKASQLMPGATLDELFAEPLQWLTFDAARDRRDLAERLYVSLPLVYGVRGRQVFVKPSPALAAKIEEAMAYGKGMREYYLQVVLAEDLDEAWVLVRYQRILGQRYVCRVPLAAAKQFFAGSAA